MPFKMASIAQKSGLAVFDNKESVSLNYVIDLQVSYK